MDANGTRFHLLLGSADWARCHDGADRPLGDRWDGAGAHRRRLRRRRDELTLQPLAVPLPQPDRRAAPLALDARAGRPGPLRQLVLDRRRRPRRCWSSPPAPASPAASGPSRTRRRRAGPAGGARSSRRRAGPGATAAPGRGRRHRGPLPGRRGHPSRPGCWCSTCRPAARPSSCAGRPGCPSRPSTWPPGPAAACSSSTATTAALGARPAPSGGVAPAGRPLATAPARAFGPLDWAGWASAAPRGSAPAAGAGGRGGPGRAGGARAGRHRGCPRRDRAGAVPRRPGGGRRPASGPTGTASPSARRVPTADPRGELSAGRPRPGPGRRRPAGRQPPGRLFVVDAARQPGLRVRPAAGCRRAGPPRGRATTTRCACSAARPWSPRPGRSSTTSATAGSPWSEQRRRRYREHATVAHRRSLDGQRAGLRLAPAADRRLHAAGRPRSRVWSRGRRRAGRAGPGHRPDWQRGARPATARGDGSELPFAPADPSGAYAHLGAAVPARPRAATCSYGWR